MIRKWSYINPVLESIPATHKVFDKTWNTEDYGLNAPSLSTSIAGYRFKAFHKTTKFRKWRRGLSQLVRRNYMKRKRRTDDYMLCFIAYDWSRGYLRRRQVVRFLQSINLAGVEGLAPDKEVFYRKIPDINHNCLQGISIYTCSVAFVKSILLFSQNIQNFFFQQSGSSTSRVQSPNLDGIQNSLEVGVGSIHLEGLSYPVDSAEVISSESVQSSLSKLYDSVFKLNLSIVAEMRKILVYLALYSSLR